MELHAWSGRPFFQPAVSRLFVLNADNNSSDEYADSWIVTVGSHNQGASAGKG
jgi:hypothetical protein